MYARTSYSAEAFPAFVISEEEGENERGGFYAGDPVCMPVSNRLEKVPYSYLFLLLGLAIGSAFASDDAVRQEWASKLERAASSLTSSGQSAPTLESPPAKDVASTAPPTSIPPPPMTPIVAVAPSQPLPEVTVTDAPGEKSEDASKKSADKHGAFDAYTPTPAGLSDPYRKKAEAAGLHPDLSRAVLSRLTPNDYRNAAYAIQTAIKTVPDDGELTWPRTHKAGTAIFNVHFVQGAARDCRRYVVTVTKDRWTSTALPMEKCGAKVAFRGSERAKSVE